jgi:metal-responsive CopG/Arc/MetJ family transcriptional regulator
MTTNKRKPLEYRRVMINIPLGLLDAFDEIATYYQYLVLNHAPYSRNEAIKKSMRRFIKDEK